MNISIMMKPASSNCNLRCKYCFYNDLSSHREMPSRGIMSQDTLRNILKKAFDFAGNDKVMLSFQGGEPLIAGKEFFKNVTRNHTRTQRPQMPRVYRHSDQRHAD